jgi:hypothetical protein
MMTERKKSHNDMEKKRKVMQAGIKTGKMIAVKDTHVYKEKGQA